MNEPSYRQPIPPRAKEDFILCAALTGIALISFDISGRIASFSGIGKLICVVLLVMAIQFANQYLLSERVMQYENGFLTLVVRQGKKEKRVGSMEIRSDCRILTREEWKAEKKNRSVKNRFDFSYHLLKGEKKVLLFPEGDLAGTALFFQPDETMLTLLQKRMEELKQQQGEAQ